MALERNDADELRQRLEDLPSLVGAVPPEVNTLVHGLLVTEENQRFALNYLREVIG